MPYINLRATQQGRENIKIRSLSLVVTRDCNLRCRYCYEKHPLRDGHILDIGLAREAITKCMNEPGFDGVEVDFFGGEPMLAFPLIRDIVDWFHTQKWQKSHRFLIGTNGTILTPEIKEWLVKNKSCVNVGLSLDGTKKAHDLSRSGSYDAVYQNLPFFMEHWPLQPAKMTICADTIPYVAESVIELENMGVIFTANIGFEDLWGDEEPKQLLLDTYEAQLSKLVDFYAGRPDLYPVQPLLTALPTYLYLPDYGHSWQKDIKRYCGAGHEMIVLDVDGREYPCHRFLPWITKKEAPRENSNCQTAWNPDKCANCKLVLSCPTCAGYNWEVNGDTGTRTTFHCQSFKREVMASAALEAIRLTNKLENVNDMPEERKVELKKSLKSVLNLLEEGLDVS